MFCDWLNSIRLMAIMFCDWLNSLRLLVIMFCDWLNSLRLMVIMFCDWLNSLRLMAIMFCDWLNSIRLMVIMFCDWLNSLGLMVLMLCDSHELCSFFYISIYLHLLYILISIYIDQFYCWRKPEDPEKTHLPVASHWPPRYNWNIVDSGVKHHKTKLTIVLAM
jgi:hypothetical protein